MRGQLPESKTAWAERRDAGLRNATMRGTIHRVTRRFQVAQRQVFLEYPRAEAMRQAGIQDKRQAIADLETLVPQFQAMVAAHGGTTHWAETREDAVRILLDIAQAGGVRRVVKSKSMVTEELEVNRHLEAAGIGVIETDLGEYIIQRAHEPPSHILAPAAHKNRHEIETLFQADATESSIAPPDSDEATDLTAYARRRLRQEFLEADLGITGGNFLVADSGTVVIITNEGNADLVVSLPRIVVSIVGVEKMIRDGEALKHLIQQPALNGVGQRLSSYTTLLSGPGANAAEGAQQWHVILLNNGRMRLRGTMYEDVLSCIRCGACLNACPVFRQVGGHAYGTVYSGPIGIVETPLLSQWGVGAELPSVACTLCQACGEVCPMDIDLPGHIVQLRAEKVERKMGTRSTRITYRTWGRWWATAPGYRRSIGLARLGQRLYERRGRLRGAPGFAQGWFQTRDMPPVAQETFHEWWERHRAPGEEHHDA